MAKSEEDKKVAQGFSITKKVNDRFRKYCEENDINKSIVVEKMIIKWMEEKK